MSLSWRLTIALAIVAPASCFLFPDLSALQGASADGGDSGSEASANLLVNAGFEHDQGGCGPGWTVTNATMSPSPTAHSGTSSCEVCNTLAGVPGWLTSSPAPVTNPPEGATYYAQAWVETVPDASLSAVQMLVLEGIPNGGRTLAFQNADVTSPSWQLLQKGSYAVDDAGTNVTFNILVTPPDGGIGCALVDDTELFPQ